MGDFSGGGSDGRERRRERERDRVCLSIRSFSYLIIGFNSPHDDGEGIKGRRGRDAMSGRFVVRAKAAHIGIGRYPVSVLSVRESFRPKIGTALRQLQ